MGPGCEGQGPQRGGGHLPVRVRLVDDQQQLELSAGGRGAGGGRVHQPGRGRRLLHGVGERAEEAAARRLLLRRRLLLLGGRRLRRLPALRGRGARGRGRGGRGRRRRRRLLRLGPLQVGHVAIGQVGDEAAVREPAPQKVHHLAGRERGRSCGEERGAGGRERGRAGWLAAGRRGGAVRSAAGLGRSLTAGRGGGGAAFASLPFPSLPSPQRRGRRLQRLARARRSRPPPGGSRERSGAARPPQRRAQRLREGRCGEGDRARPGAAAAPDTSPKRSVPGSGRRSPGRHSASSTPGLVMILEGKKFKEGDAVRVRGDAALSGEGRAWSQPGGAGWALPTLKSVSPQSCI